MGSSIACPGHGGPGYGKIAASSGAAKDTAAGIQRAIPVRAGETGINGYFFYFFPICVFQVSIQRIIPFSVPFSGGHFMDRTGGAIVREMTVSIFFSALIVLVTFAAFNTFMVHIIISKFNV